MNHSGKVILMQHIYWFEANMTSQASGKSKYFFLSLLKLCAWLIGIGGKDSRMQPQQPSVKTQG